MFDIIWVSFSKNQEERRKNFNEYLPVIGENLDKTKKIVSQKALFWTLTKINYFHWKKERVKNCNKRKKDFLIC